MLNIYGLPEIVDNLGHTRVLGTIPSDPRFVQSLPTWREAGNETISEGDWKEFDIWPSEIKIKDQNGYGACFPAGTRVRMEDGSERSIEGVRLLDRVLTAEGNIGRVIKTMVRDATDGLIRLSLWGHSHLRATPDHPVLTKNGYVSISELKIDDWVAMPRYLPASKATVHVADHLPHRVMMTRAGTGRRNFNAPEGRTKIEVILTPIPEVIRLTVGVGRIFGLFFAEGRSDPGKLTWTFNKTEEKTLVADLVDLLRSEWDVSAHLQFRPNNSINVVVYGTPWAKLFESLCSNGSGNKRIHEDLASGPRDFLESFLDGWLDGDGHSRRGTVQGVTISRDLALGMFDIAQGLGRRPAIRRYHSPTYGAVKVRHARWEVTMSGDKDTYRCKLEDSHVWRKVNGIEWEEFSGPVFNLEVEGDNSYVSEGIGVHNCNGHAAALGLELARYVAGYAHIPLSAWFVYAPLCGGIDRGSSISDALSFLLKNGSAPEADVPYGTINPNRITSAAKTDALRYRMEVGSSLSTWQEIMSAVQLRKPINLSVHASNSFANLDSEGVPPVVRGSGNHAVTVAFGAKKSPKWGWLVKMPNSWGTKVGQNGFWWLAEAHIEAGSYFQGYCVAAAYEDPQNPDNPPDPV